MIHTEEPTTEAWVLLTAVHEAGESCVTLAATVPGCVTGPGEALIELVQALSQAKRNLATERGGAR